MLPGIHGSNPALGIYRVFLYACPLLPGDIEAGSRQEFIYHVYVLFYLLVFYPVMRSGFMPAPLMRTYYLALGARLGDNTYSQGIIHDHDIREYWLEFGDWSVGTADSACN